MKSIHSPHSKSLLPARPLRASLNSSRQSSASSVISANNSFTSDDGQEIMPVLNSTTLKIGSSHEVFISHVENGPKKFFVHLKANDQKLNKMMAQIEDISLKNLSRKPKVGMAVLARYSEDKSIYRAFIQSIMIEECQVVFADYGNTEMVSPENLFDIPQEFLHYRTFAIGFSLSKIKTISYEGDLDEIFKELVLDKQLIMKVVPIESPSFVQNCELYTETSNINIFDEIIKRTKPVPLVYPPPIDFPDGSSDEIIIRYVNSAKDIYVQPNKQDLAFNSMLDKLSLCLNKNSTQLKPLKIGEPCAVKYNNEWYRGEVVQVIALPNVEVKLVDYGFTATVNKENVKNLPSEFFKYEPFVVQCCLTGFENVHDDDNSTTQLEMLAEDDTGGRKVFRMQVLKKESGLCIVNLYDESKSPILDISKRLLKLKNPVSFQKNVSSKASIATTMSSTLISETTATIVNEQSIDTIDLTTEDLSGSFQTPVNSNENRFSMPRRTPRPDIPRFNVRTRLQLNESNGTQDTTMSTSGFNSQATNHDHNADSFKSSTSSIDSVENFVPLNKKYRKTIVPMHLKVPVTFLLWVTPQSFFVKLSSDEENFVKMMKDMQKFYKNKNTIEIHPPDQSSIVVKNKDGLFCRGTILAYNEEQKKYRVYLVDFGKKIIVAMDDIYRVDKRFLELAAMAVECSLQEVLAIDAKDLLSKIERYIPKDENVECTFLDEKENKVIATVIVGEADLKMHLILDNQVKQLISDIDLHRLKGQTMKLKLVEVKNMEQMYARLCGDDALLKCQLTDTDKSAQLLDALRVTIDDYIVAKIEDVAADKALIIKPILPQFNQKDLPVIPDMPMLMDKSKVTVCYVESANCLYVQNQKWTDEIAKLLDDMFEFYERKGEELRNLAIHEICAAKSADQNWYRAKVTYLHGIDDVEVYYIDYGNTERVKHNDLKVLDPSFMEFGAFAQNVYLPMTCPNDKEVIEEVRNLTMEMTVDLHILELKNEKWIADVIINGNSIIDVLMSKWQQIARVPIEEMFQNLKTPAPAKFVIVEESEISESQVVEENEIVNNNIDKNKRHEAIISHCDSPNQVFIQMKSDFKDLDGFQDDLQIVAPQLQPLTDFSLNRYCLAKYSGDDLWYRSKIIDPHEDLIVQFIDFGNTDVVTSNKKNELKQIPDCYMKKKVFAKRCALMIGPVKGGQWPETVIDYVRDIFDCIDVEFIAEVKNIHYVKMFVNGEDIAEKLVHDESAVKWQYIPSGEKCFTSHVYNLKEFYVQLEKDVDVLELMAIHLENESNFSVLENPEIGNYCVARYKEDGMWYRAIITEICNDDEYEVIFVDYGNKERTNEVRKLDDAIGKQRQLCTKCTLKLPENVKNWSPEAELKFLELTACGETIFTVNLVIPGPKAATVELFLDGQNIIYNLVHLCEEGIDNIMNSSIYSTDDKNQLDFNIHGEKVLICHANSPADFYIQFGTDGIRNMEELLANNANQYQIMPVNDIDFGKLCIVQLPNTGVYYRAQVFNFKEGEYKVKLMDYGSTMIVNELKKMPDRLAEMEFLASHCCLEKFDIAAEVTDEVKRKFYELTSKKHSYTFEIVEDHRSQIEIRLFNENGENILDVLKSSGN